MHPLDRCVGLRPNSYFEPVARRRALGHYRVGRVADDEDELAAHHAAEAAVDEVAHAPNRGWIGESDAQYRDTKGGAS